ncbi:MAG TPA: flagellar FliJ family protein [Vicinamibacterales bacterium]|jgi:flagellar export protein FliJ
MANFRFRAQVALDLRRKQDDDAQRALGEAKRATAAAQRAVQDAERALVETQERAREEAARASDTTRAIWYRNWIRRQQQVIVAARHALEQRLDEERVVAARAMEARRKLRSLEHLRDRTWKAFQLAERKAEQKEFDVLGGLRYVALREVPEGA